MDNPLKKESNKEVVLKKDKKTVNGESLYNPAKNISRKSCPPNRQRKRGLRDTAPPKKHTQ
jgi:hypothetical protein